MAKKNPFDKFAIHERTEYIKALDAEVTFRPLTKKEADAFSVRLLKNYNGSDDMNIDLEEANKINMEKVALCLIEPKLTVNDMLQYGSEISDAINEIAALIDGRSVDTESDTEPAEGTDAGN